MTGEECHSRAACNFFFTYLTFVIDRITMQITERAKPSARAGRKVDGSQDRTSDFLPLRRPGCQGINLLNNEENVMKRHGYRIMLLTVPFVILGILCVSGAGGRT